MKSQIYYQSFNVCYLLRKLARKLKHLHVLQVQGKNTFNNLKGRETAGQHAPTFKVYTPYIVYIFIIENEDSAFYCIILKRNMLLQNYRCSYTYIIFYSIYL